MEARKSRRESQAETRARLLAVAGEVLIDSGYSSASLERIAERAGYSKGAVYSNFASKEELVLAVLDAHFAHRLIDLRERLALAPETVDARVDAFVGWWQNMLLHEGWGLVTFEFAGATRDRPRIQEGLGERIQMIVNYCTNLIEAEVERFELDLAVTPREAAETLVSLALGLSFSRTLLPSIRSESLTQTARLILLGPGDAAGPVSPPAPAS